jgi:hypothetical protein
MGLVIFTLSLEISAKSIDEYDKLVGSLYRYHSGTIGWHSKLVQ